MENSTTNSSSPNPPKTDEAVIRPAPGGNIDLTATHPSQLPHLQQGLLEWAKAKVIQTQCEFDDAHQARETAALAGFRVDRLNAVRKAAYERFVYYQKIVAALEAGYVLMPSLDASVFAVRTTRSGPRYQVVKFNPANLAAVSAMPLPQGEGKYVSNVPTSMETTVTVSNIDHTKQPPERGTRQVLGFQAKGFGEIDFPLSVARPEIVERVSYAMKQLIFDEIAVAPPEWSKRGDPIVIGRIIAPTRRDTVRNRRRIAFMLAWTVPTLEI